VSGYKAQQPGKPTTQRYNCGSVLIDHASRYVYLQLHHSTGGAEAKSAKHNFERITKESGIQIKAYRAESSSKPNFDLLWSRSTSPEWDCRKISSYPNREITHNVATCNDLLARSNYYQLLDLHNSICSPNSQCHPFTLWFDTRRNIYWT
jgi:hypothetical protein